MLFLLFMTFFKIGLFTFGGGYAMIAQIKEIVVEKNKWLTEDELMEIIAIAESTPGPIAINMATYVGYKKKGFWGSLMATLGVVLPSMIIIYIISLFLDAFMENKYVAYAFVGIKCAVAFLILRAGIGMFEKLQKKTVPMLIFSAVFALMIVFELLSVSFSSIVFIAAGGLIGISLSLLCKKGGDGMIYLILFLEFFKIGLFTIGGGFAMIPLIEETVVAHGWLTQGEFFDLVGVCESTPGPIAVNMATYIGSQQGGLFGSCTATLGVVLPSFLIILLIASIMKNLTNTKAFKGFMDGVKPVVTALILATGVLFLVKAVGFAGIGKFDFDPVAVIIFALVCGIYFVYKAVAKKKISSVALIIISAALGIGVSMIFEVTA